MLFGDGGGGQEHGSIMRISMSKNQKKNMKGKSALNETFQEFCEKLPTGFNRIIT